MSVIASAFKTMAASARCALAARQFARAAPALRTPAAQPRRAFRVAAAAMAKYGSEKKGEYPSMGVPHLLQRGR